MRPVVVFDTNVLISALLTPTGQISRCVDLARRGEVGLVTCQPLLDELGEKLLGKFRASPDKVRAVIEEFRRMADVVSVSGRMAGATADPDDDVVLECAVAG